MVARPGTYQASNNAGELAPQEYGRTDLKQFYSGMATMLNVEPVPQGGSQLSMRTRHMGRIRTLLQTVALSSATLPAGPYSGVAVLATANFEVVAPVAAIVLPNWSASQPVTVQLEYLGPGDVWFTFSAPFILGTTAGTITGATPPPLVTNCTQVRLRLIVAPPSPTTISGEALVVKMQSSTFATARHHPFTFSLDQTYVAVLTSNFADFYRDGVWVGASVTGFVENHLPVLDVQQRLDTMLLFHIEVGSQRILRDGSDAKWLLSDIPFENVPLVDLGGSYTNQVVDVWKVYIRYPTSGSFANGTSLFISFNVNGEDTYGIPTAGAAAGPPLPLPGSGLPPPGGGPPGSPPPDPAGGVANWPAFAAAVKDAIEALPSISPGIAVSEDHSTAGTTILTIIFTGDRNIGSRNTMSAEVVNTAEAAANVSHFVIGDPGGEALISPGRGYASCGAFYQDRLISGGFRSKRGAWLASASGEYFDLNIRLAAASGAILANIDTHGAEQLQRIVSDKYLLLFTSDAEYFVADRALDRTKPPTIVNSSRYGSAPDLPVLANEGEIVFASRNKSTLYAAAFDEVAASYVAKPISLLAPHIVNAMTGMALQRPSGVGNAARLWMPRADGTMTVGILLRDQQVTAFVRWATSRGLVQAACVDGKNVAYLLVQRFTGEDPSELHLERLETGLLFDDVVEQNFAPAQRIVGGLAIHESEEVWAEADGYVVGPFRPRGGEIDLGFAANNVKVGRWTPPVGKTLPLPSEVAERTVLRRPKRVHTVRLDLVDTTSVAVGANDQPARNVALARAGGAIDAPQAPVNRTVVVTGIRGVSDTGQVVITQTRPGQLGWRGITIEART